MGGFCLAFAKEGFKVAWANEKDNFAALTYEANFPATTLHHKPIQELSVVTDDLIAIDVLTAGFPCQPFSVAGSKMGFDDDRGKAFFDIIREFGDDRPKILLFENVPHLLTHDRGRTFNRITLRSRRPAAAPEYRRAEHARSHRYPAEPRAALLRGAVVGPLQYQHF